MNKFRVGDICIFTPKDRSTRECFIGKRCRITKTADITPNWYQMELLECVKDEPHRDVLPIGWKCNVQESQLELSGPRPKYTTNALGDFPKKEA